MLVAGRGEGVPRYVEPVGGVLRRDSEAVIDEFLCRDAHYTFVETLPQTEKRNPQVFVGKYITITRRDDGLVEK